MDLYIEGLTGTVFELKVSPFETIKSVKSKIQRAEGIPMNQQHLIWQNNELQDDCSLRDYEISCGATLRLVLGMRGGPINTRRVLLSSPSSPVFSSCSSPSLHSACTSPQPSSGSAAGLAGHTGATGASGIINEGSEHTATATGGGNTHITLLVFKEGDQINFYRVVDKNDPSLSPVVEALPDSPILTDDNGEEHMDKSEKDGDEAIFHPNNSSDDELELRSTNLSRVLEDHGSWLPDWLRYLPQPPLLPKRYPPLRFNSLSKNISSNNMTGIGNSKESNTETASQEEKLLREKCTNLQKKLEQLKLSKQSKQNKAAVVGVRPSSRQMLRNGQLAPLQNKPKVLEATPQIQNISPSLKHPTEVEQKSPPVMDYPPLFPNGECNIGLKYSTKNYTKSLALPSNKLNTNGLPQISTDFNKIPGTSIISGRSSSLGPPALKGNGEEMPDKARSRRCFLCNKKTGLATSYDCRCGNTFCSRHRYAETHQCTYDYKSEGRRWLKESNPMISASKLPKI